jgi:hypothetical protein
VPAKYSLEALRTLRAAREESRGRELAERLKAVALRAAEAEALKNDLARQQLERRQGRAAEAQRLAEQGMSAAELERGVEREHAQSFRELCRQTELERASDAQRTAERDRDKAVALLAEAHADRQAVERHHQGFRLEQQRAAEDAEDENAVDRWNGNHFRSGQP